MPKKHIEVECPTCGHKMKVNLADYELERTIFKGQKKDVKVEEYRFQCPQDGTYFIVPVTVEE